MGAPGAGLGGGRRVRRRRRGMSAERAREIRRESGEAGPTRGLGAYVGSTRDPGALPGLPRPGAPPSFPPGPAPLSPRARPGLLRWPLCPLTPAPGSFTPSRGLLHTPPVPFRPPGSFIPPPVPSHPPGLLHPPPPPVPSPLPGLFHTPPAPQCPHLGSRPPPVPPHTRTTPPGRVLPWAQTGLEGGTGLGWAGGSPPAQSHVGVHVGAGEGGVSYQAELPPPPLTPQSCRRQRRKPSVAGAWWKRPRFVTSWARFWQAMVRPRGSGLRPHNGGTREAPPTPLTAPPPS